MADTKVYLSGGRIQGASTDEEGAVESLGSAADLDINSGSHPTGKRSNGYSVTSSQYAQAGGSSGSLSQFKFLHEPNCKWSISFWLKVASSGSGIADGKGIMGTADGATSEIGLSLKMNGTSSLLMHMRGSDYAARPASNNGCIPSDGNWHHYVMTHDHTLATTNTVLFKDGSAFTMQGADGGGNKEDNSNSTSNHNNPFTIGGADTGEGGSFAFSIDDVSFYDRVLTSAEKVSLYNSGNSIDADDVSVDGLKAFWDMNESGDFINVTATDEKATLVTDSLGSTLDATNSGATADSATAINGKASLTFDNSNDWINLGTGLNSSIDGKAFSISAWVYVSATNITDATIIGKQVAGYSSPYHVFNVRAHLGDWSFTTNDGSNYQGDTTTAISHTGWTHIVATFDGTSSFKVYADNVEVCSYSNANTNWSNSYWSLGNGEGTTRWWDSEIQDVAVWSRVLTSGERTTLLNSYAHGTATSSGNTGKVATDISTTGLLAYYTLNDTTTGVTNSAKVFDLPENTLFDETDTYNTWWLQDDQWKGEEVTFDLTTDPTWQTVGSGQTYSSGNDRLDYGFSSAGMGSFDMLGKAISDTKWRLRFKWVATGQANYGGGNGTFGYIGLIDDVDNISSISATSGTPLWSGTYNFTGFMWGVNVFGGSYTNAVGTSYLTNDNIFEPSAFNGSTGGNQQGLINGQTTFTWYMEIKRTSATELIFNMYNNSAYSGTPSYSRTKTIVAAELNNLRRFIIVTSASSGNLEGYIDDIEIRNGW